MSTQPSRTPRCTWSGADSDGGTLRRRARASPRIHAQTSHPSSMRTQIEWIIIGTYAAALFVLSLFSLNRYVMISLFRRYRGHPRVRPPEPSPMPRVTVQLQIGRAHV